MMIPLLCRSREPLLGLGRMSQGLVVSPRGVRSLTLAITVPATATSTPAPLSVGRRRSSVSTASAATVAASSVVAAASASRSSLGSSCRTAHVDSGSGCMRSLGDREIYTDFPAIDFQTWGLK